MKKFLSLVLALCMCAMMTVAGLAESRMPEELNGTYIDLFPEFAKEEYKDFWMENIGAYITDAEAAEGTYTAMTQGFMGTLKGQAAIDAYAADPAATVFNCSLENGLKKVTVNNGEISGTDAEGNVYGFMQGDTLGILIGRRGETLDALQYLTSLKVNRGRDSYTRVTLDTENYRAKREDTLIRLANRMANRALRTGRKVSLEPMNPYERRIIHFALQQNEGVTTHSEGDEPNRHVVITHKK